MSYPDPDKWKVVLPAQEAEALDTPQLRRCGRTDWQMMVDIYAQMKIGEGLLANATLNVAKRDLDRAFARRGLDFGTDYTVKAVHVDVDGNRLPTGNWLQYIKKLSDADPTLI